VAQRHLRAVQAARRRLDRARDELGDRILQAHRSGESYQDIAQWAGLSKSRVQELAQQAAERG